MRTIRVTTVNIEVDETATAYLVFVSPRVEAQRLGIGYHRSRLPKCLCPAVVGAQPGTGFKGTGSRCRVCQGWSADGMARHVGKLLRSYPKVSVRVPAEQLLSTRAVWPRVGAA